MAKKRKSNTLKHPAADQSWRQDFTAATFRTSFTLSLSQAMVEYLSAVADGVCWERSQYNQGLHKPDNFIATSAALMNRGLITRKCESEISSEKRFERNEDSLWEWSNYRLTPAGEALIELFKVTGIFVEADAAITKKLRG